MFFRSARNISLVLAGFCCGLGALAMSQDLPPGHPAMPPAQPDAKAEDVESIDAIINAYYNTISGAKGEARDWDRLRSLFMPDARLVTVRNVHEAALPAITTTEEFIQGNRNYFEKGGYYESELHREVDEFGSVAHVLSTYASRRAATDPKPYSRGLNSIQLIRTGKRWWIVTIMWDYERPEGPMIPADLLGQGDGGAP